jgi:hypothetical protein
VADDLIPPPSPAGRPGAGLPEREPARLPPGPADDRGGGGLWAGEPRAGGVAGRGEPVQARDEPAEPPPPEPLPPSPYRPRFGFVAGALVGVAVAAVALAAVLIGGLGSGVRAGWSEWRPSSEDGVGAAREIAEHVAPKYRQANGEQLVLVEAGPLAVQTPPVPLAGVAVRANPAGGDIQLIEGDAVMYTLNGLGDRGSVAAGKPTEERHLLLRREALELALYTFQYARNIDLVVALLPPNAEAVAKAALPIATPQQVEQARPQALLFRPVDLRPQLESPLQDTIPLRTPRPETIAGSEARTIDRLTRPNLFKADFKQAQNLRAYLVLDKFAP